MTSPHRPLNPRLSCSPARPPALAESRRTPNPNPNRTHSKEEIEFLLAELRAGQEEFEAHLAKYTADREALDQGWDELVEAQDRLEEEYEDFDASVRASDEAAARRAAMFERRANMLLDQEMELDLLKRRYMDKIRNYELISLDLKRREDRFFAGLDHVHILAEDTEALRMQNEASGACAARGVERRRGCLDGRLEAPEATHQGGPIVPVRLCLREQGGVESWNDDEVPALLLGEEGRETERANRVRAIVDEEKEEAR
jgi:hypothetical protein